MALPEDEQERNPPTMSETVLRAGGGWGTAAAFMSPGVAARVAAADHEYDRQTARQRRERAELLAADEQRRIRASIVEAEARGELVDIRRAIRDGGVGHTPAEFIALVSAQQDREDARRAAIARREIARIGADRFYAENSADTSAPLEADVAADEALLARGRAVRAERRKMWKVAVAAAAATVRRDQPAPGRTASSSYRTRETAAEYRVR